MTESITSNMSYEQHQDDLRIVDVSPSPCRAGRPHVLTPGPSQSSSLSSSLRVCLALHKLTRVHAEIVPKRARSPARRGAAHLAVKTNDRRRAPGDGRRAFGPVGQDCRYCRTLLDPQSGGGEGVRWCVVVRRGARSISRALMSLH